ncbi:hypothetical protein AMTRI_Chr02g266370 [Amborella trichopoda]
MKTLILVQASAPPISIAKTQQSSTPPVSTVKSTKDEHFAYLSPLETCNSMLKLRQIHSQIIRTGLARDNDAIGRVVKFCAISNAGNLDYALQVFDQIPQPDAFIWNTIIRGQLEADRAENCLSLYTQMLSQSVVPNKYTFPSIVKACSCIKEGKQVHAHVFKHGFDSDLFSQNNLINMYFGYGDIDGARRVFDQMTWRDVVSWTTLISGYANAGLIEEARLFFDAMPERNSVSWNAMIAAYVRSCMFQEAFALFERMQQEKLELDKFAAASMLSACTGLGALEQGKWIHGHIEKTGIELDMKLATTIIDMYCKCGCLEKAVEVFNGLPQKGISSRNCMIVGLAMHGQATEAIELFREMERENVTPDDITFVGVLNACAHSGLVKEGYHYFESMTRVYGIKPKIEHYGCMVDLLGRAGLLVEAKNLIDEMPMKPDAVVLGALFGACKIHGNIEIGEQVGKQVIELEPHNSGRYVLLANLYATFGRWEDVANVRKLMNNRGVNKPPGCSMIEMDGVVSEFIAGGRSHPQSKEIYSMAEEMLRRLKLEGYVPHKEGVLHDIEEEEKESPLYYHSEKLAIAFGLLNTSTGETIRIVKNLRVCRDCHNAMKLISKVYGREIVVRDRNRFHHFSRGECSCKDYW